TEQYSAKQLLHHYSSMAKRQWMTYLNGTGEKIRYKKYLYALNPIFAAMWIKLSLQATDGQSRLLPPIRFVELMETLADVYPEVRAIVPPVMDLINRKTVTLEADDLPRVAPIEEFLRTSIQQMRQFAEQTIEERQPDMMRLEDLCQRTIKQYQG
ncbi:MAG: nucleotidyltransferase domain-containing protein, partial [Pseudomonadota bacterium]|nr:nucleotidyltransferase domain-containing protein [Pseudomonadota bacterium]